jgi:hypothetical protein
MHICTYARVCVGGWGRYLHFTLTHSLTHARTHARTYASCLCVSVCLCVCVSVCLCVCVSVCLCAYGCMVVYVSVLAGGEGGQSLAEQIQAMKLKKRVRSHPH